MLLTEAHSGNRCLGGDGIDLAEQGVDQRQHLALQGSCAGKITGKDLVGHFHSHFGDNIGQHADAAYTAHSHHCHGQGVLAGVDIDTVAALGENFNHLAHIAAGFLDSHDVFVVSQLGNGGRQQIAAGTAGDIVKDHGLLRSIGDGGVVCHQTGLGCLVVVGGNCQNGISTSLDGVVYSVTPETAEAFFEKEVLSRIGK